MSTALTRTALTRTAVAGVAIVAAVTLGGCGSGIDGSATPGAAPAADLGTAVPPSSSPAGTSVADVPDTSAPAASASSAPGGAASAALCPTANLRVTLNKSAGDADMQGSHLPLVFTNTGSRSCTLRSAPGVSYVAGDSGQQVGAPATRYPGGAKVTLAPGASASAALFLSSAPQKSDCHQVQARGLRIYPPGNTGAAFVPLPTTTCSDGGPYLTVDSVRAGAANAGS
ncbi:uncharacterized protein DUF4232 [Amycolatopsis sulphurea]|uniref:Uncharacterized protein DUF4232 n=1 Tax=Amycolatopsis sulphurea TaxID=76022 RepID=A0A2A9FID1_9PSEU|nr:DUF4232 domain-containing protein [Amycolatopsis sulphurea]PFG50908.1 uncharacterized protein DUF4232 [Amycolatopsis sulphurea]